jgi:hypothetical protein
MPIRLFELRLDRSLLALCLIVCAWKLLINAYA